MDTMFEQLDKEGGVDIKECVLEMRHHRKDMVQTVVSTAYNF